MATLFQIHLLIFGILACSFNMCVSYSFQFGFYGNMENNQYITINDIVLICNMFLKVYRPGKVGGGVLQK